MALSDMPIGTIIAWENTTIPTDWAVCDGNNGTPNMVGRFVMGAGVDGDVRATGGNATHTHTMPNTSTRTTHSHGGYLQVSTGGGSSSIKATSGAGAYQAPSPSHTHGNVGITIYSAGSHSHTVGNTGSADNNPTNVRRVFIKRIS